MVYGFLVETEWEALVLESADAIRRAGCRLILQGADAIHGRWLIAAEKPAWSVGTAEQTPNEVSPDVMMSRIEVAADAKRHLDRASSVLALSRPAYKWWLVIRT